MVAVRLYFQGDRVGPVFRRGTVRQRDAVLRATRTAASQVQQEALTRSRRNIANAGNFGPRWTEGLHVDQTEGGGSIRLGVHHDVPYFMVHQRGALIRGRPLLWIPLSFASDAKGVSARDYPGGLFRVDRLGKSPLLLSMSGEPKYSGHASVRIPKRFRVIEICREVFLKLGAYYNRALNQQSGSTQ